jgi:hypothetical protein
MLNNSVRPEPFGAAQDRPVEGLRAKGFDRLSPNGSRGIYYPFYSMKPSFPS